MASKEIKKGDTFSEMPDSLVLTEARIIKNFNLFNIYTVLIEEKELLKKHIKVLNAIKTLLILEEIF